MKIHNNTLIAECSAYDFKEMLERKKVKSWLKSVSAFANTDGGSLFYGVNDDGIIVGTTWYRGGFIADDTVSILGFLDSYEFAPY